MLAITLLDSTLFDDGSILIEYLNACVNIDCTKMELCRTGFKIFFLKTFFKKYVSLFLLSALLLGQSATKYTVCV